MATGHPNIVLGEGLSATGSAVQWTPGGAGVAFISGTFDSATMELQVRARSTQDWITLTTFAGGVGSNTAYAFTLPSCEMRLKINSPGGSTSLDAYVVGFSP